MSEKKLNERAMKRVGKMLQVVYEENCHPDLVKELAIDSYKLGEANGFSNGYMVGGLAMVVSIIVGFGCLRLCAKRSDPDHASTKRKYTEIEV